MRTIAIHAKITQFFNSGKLHGNLYAIAKSRKAGVCDL